MGLSDRNGAIFRGNWKLSNSWQHPPPNPPHFSLPTPSPPSFGAYCLSLMSPINPIDITWCTLVDSLTSFTTGGRTSQKTIPPRSQRRSHPIDIPWCTLLDSLTSFTTGGRTSQKTKPVVGEVILWATGNSRDKDSKGQLKLEDSSGGLLPAEEGHSLERNRME